jgi:putative membrane protein
MALIAGILTAIVAALHIGFLILEMFLWQTPIGMRIFHLTPAFAKESAVLAKNQGLYNGVLAAGLIWSFFIDVEAFQVSVRTFFLASVIVVGVYGALTAKFRILYIQALPALLALLAVLYSAHR